ncbi:MAG: acyl-CoA dehydratase activase [Planctomycetota bacterium]
MNYAVGIDVGSTQTKAVALDTARAVVARALIDTGANVKRAGQRALDALIETAGIARGDVKFVVGTGYGRYKIEAGDTQVTEISCHARGAHLLFPSTRTVIDMGGQDTKAIKIGPEGDVLDFCMNDKCAAGTGRFLAGAAEVLGLKLDEIGGISLRGRNPIRLTSVCTVFVESDILSHLAQNQKIEDILAGVHEAIATRTVGLVRRVGIEPQITFTGGVARNVGMVKALEGKLGMELNADPEAHFCGALGAALFAMDHVLAAYQPTVAVGAEPAVWVDE